VISVTDVEAGSLPSGGISLDFRSSGGTDTMKHRGKRLRPTLEYTQGAAVKRCLERFKDLRLAAECFAKLRECVGHLTLIAAAVKAMRAARRSFAQALQQGGLCDRSHLPLSSKL